jgi:ADP-heptose:LPS heptosyltransferase
MVKLIRHPKPPSPVGLRDFYNKRNTVLIVRECGGLGDILMHRMMFEDFKRVFPGCKIVWAVPPDYIHASENHPFVDEVVNCRTVRLHDYLISYNTTTACGRYEAQVAPFADKHRSDIWASHCGVILTKHNMHLHIDQEAKRWAIDKIRQLKGKHKGPTVVFSPVSAQAGKNLSKQQMMMVAKYLHQKGCFVVGLHNSPLYDLKPFSTIWNIGHKQWMAVIDCADYVVSVDTSTFHCAGGLKKPLTGIFTFIDGKVYGKYYDFVLVQKHRDDGNWDCGPCFAWPQCPKCKDVLKPCLTELTPDILANGLERMFQKWPITLS